MNKIEQGLKEAKEGKLERLDLEDLIYKPRRWNKWDRFYWLIRYGIWNWITDLKWRIPNWWQRGQRGWGYADTWGFDFYLSKVIYGGLVHLKKHKCGYPITIPKIETEWTEVDYKANEKIWDEIMDKMIYAFKLAKEIGEGEREFYKPYMDENFQKTYKCLSKEEDDAMKEGMKLFIDHFFSLWD